MIKYISIVIQITPGLARNLQKYSIQSDTSIASTVSSTKWLIQSHKKFDKTSCLVECNLKVEYAL